MKKVSTRAAAQSRNISPQKLTIGLDLGDRNSWYWVVDETGQIQLEQRVLSKPGLIATYRLAFGICTHVGESSATSRNSANQSLRDDWFADSAVLHKWRGNSSSSPKVPHERASSKFC